MEIEHRPDFKRFVIQINEDIAELRYHKKKNVMYFTHTHVPKELRGQGIAGKLAKHGLEYARENGLKVEASCSYITGFLEKHPEYQDLRA